METNKNMVRFFIDDNNDVEWQHYFSNDFCVPRVGENVLLHSFDLPQYKVKEVSHWYDDNGFDMIDITLETIRTNYDDFEF